VPRFSFSVLSVVAIVAQLAWLVLLGRVIAALL
jgi:hypothetical protein